MKSLDQIRKIKSYKKLQKALNERALELMSRYNLDYLSKIEWDDIKTQNDWEKTKEQALKDFFSGEFLISSMGGIKNNRPSLVAIVFYLRRACIEECQLTSVPELLILDSALIAFYRFHRVNWIIGNFERVVEFEFYEANNPKLKYDEHFKATGYTAEEHIQKMVESLLPSLERFNKMFLRNLKALRDWKRSIAILNIENLNQLNLAKQQVNIGKTDSSEPSVKT